MAQKKCRKLNPEQVKIQAAAKRKRNAAQIKNYAAKYRRSKTGQAVIQKRLSRPGFWKHHHEVLQANKQRSVKQKLHNLMQAHLCLRGKKKSDPTVKLLGARISVVCAHIESKFQPGMNWSNHGFDGWHYDHIRPCSSFDLTDPEQQKQCFHYTNLQPLWAEDNLRKSDKWEAVAA
jgi:hypothetical protein